MREEENMYKKTIHRLEKNAQAAKIKLSVTHSENSEQRTAIDNLRRNKVLFLQIRNDLVSIKKTFVRFNSLSRCLCGVCRRQSWRR
jgi:hypothetical protein